jgi:two-component system response regulator RegX3
VAQLVLRVQAVLRRSHIGLEEATHIRLGDQVVIDVRNLTGSRNGESLPFTRRETEILRYLQANSERPVPRDELLAKVWGYGRTLGIETRTVDIHVAKLRRKIEPNPALPRYLVTVRGAGYRLITG